MGRTERCRKAEQAARKPVTDTSNTIGNYGAILGILAIGAIVAIIWNAVLGIIEIIEDGR